jgi:hypothetical protein
MPKKLRPAVDLMAFKCRTLKIKGFPPQDNSFYWNPPLLTDSSPPLPFTVWSTSYSCNKIKLNFRVTRSSFFFHRDFFYKTFSLKAMKCKIFMNTFSFSNYTSVTICKYIYVFCGYVFPVNKYLLNPYTVIFFYFILICGCVRLIFW